MNFSNVVILVILSLLLSSCTGSKKYAKKAKKLEKAGLYQDAADFYEESLKRNSANVDARIGLRTNGSKKLDDLFGAFYKAHAIGDSKKAVYAYLKAKTYHKTLGYYKIDLDFPSHYESLYEASKKEFLSALYVEGTKLKEEENFALAEKNLAKS